MRAGRAARWAGGFALGIALFARAAEPPSAEVRVLSGSGPQAPKRTSKRSSIRRVANLCRATFAKRCKQRCLSLRNAFQRTCSGAAPPSRISRKAAAMS